ncbi:MAG: Oligopeptide/dipeptide ABC transporter, ATPase subunit [Acetothermia bacterium 64_32]|nr:MAG: Oligopeptide/dipeptide ABC transporter, ATPase subunit [Acetothermia bacterium 64_32]MBC7099643.1 ABC transporter ATP-binding protein [Candidatus Bipolaricaulota bacterium]HAF70480.1 ABC transporter ATP-binding protein [Candidatus Acetothermia bacterium]
MALKVEGLRVYYQTLRGDVRALDGASFSVGDGEIMGLAGESGCGKSTLGRSLILLKPPMKYVGGEVLLDGDPLPIWDRERMAPYRYKKVSIIPQQAMNALNPTRKIGRLIRELLEARGVSSRDLLPELKRRLDLVELSHEVLKMYPIELSGGMKQRVVMVISTLLDPSLLIADEVTSALDVSTQKRVAEMLVGFRDHKFVRSMIVITHDISILYQIADSILVMYAGKLAEKGPTEAIVRRPRHPYTQLLISSLPEIGVRHTERRLSGIPGSPPPLLEPPQGCRFRERCPVAFDRCREEPPFEELAPGHLVACWRAHG